MSPYIAVIYQTKTPINEKDRVLHHGNSKKCDKPYIKTSQNVFEKTKKLISEGMSSKKIYDKVNEDSGGPMYSTSQSNELRDTRQVYRQSSKSKKEGQETVKCDDELASFIRYQKSHQDFLRTVACLQSSYYVFLGDNKQLDDVAKFCCEMNEVLCIDTTFNLCENWITDTCYRNLRLENSEGNHPIFMGPCIIHFQKDEFVFNRFISEMCSYQQKIKDLKTIGTDLEKAIFNGFKTQLKDLNLLLCVYHLEKNDRKKLLTLSKEGKSTNKILKDIYGVQYGGIKELGLADSRDVQDFRQKLNDLKPVWENLCPGFHGWFSQKRGRLFEECVIESARKSTNVHGLFYNNGIESQHFRQKNEQCFEKKNVCEVLQTLQALVNRQENDEIMALYGSGPYRLSGPYKKFQRDSVVFHNMSIKEKERLIRSFRSYSPNLGDNFRKPESSGRKPSQTKRLRNPPAEVYSERAADVKKIKINDPNSAGNIVYELFARSKVPLIVKTCQGNCGKQLTPNDEVDYVLIKSFGPSTYMHKGESVTKYGPQYVHFHQKCLKEYARRKHDKIYDEFPMEEVKVDEATRELLDDRTKDDLRSYGINI